MELSRLLSNARIWSTSPDFSFDTDIVGIATDSRAVAPGDAFVAIDGTHKSGEDFVPEAIARGARLVVCERRLDGAPYAAAEDARRAAAVMWSNLFGSPGDDLDVICVTGTCGKSSVSSMLHHILCTLGVKCGLVGTLGAFCGREAISLGGESEISDFDSSAMTTPDPKYLYGALAEMRRRGCSAAIIEASSHAIAQNKLAPISPRLSVFTNLSPEHLDFHGDMDGYFRAKARLFAASERAVVCGDDFASRLISTYVPSGRVAYVSKSSDRGAYTYGGETTLGLDGVAYTLRCGERSFAVKVPIAGEFTVVNSALAAVAAVELGADADSVADALLSAPPLSGRMETLYCGEFTVMRDFAHTPRAMRRALEFARTLTTRRLVCVFGCGGDRDKTKRAPMGEIAAQLCDFAIVTSDNPRTEDPDAIIGDILAGCERFLNVAAIPDRREAIEYAASTLAKGDVLILLGKGHETWQIDRLGKHPFDEREIVREIIEK